MSPPVEDGGILTVSPVELLPGASSLVDDSSSSVVVGVGTGSLVGVSGGEVVGSPGVLVGSSLVDVSV